MDSPSVGLPVHRVPPPTDTGAGASSLVGDEQETETMTPLLQQQHDAELARKLALFEQYDAAQQAYGYSTWRDPTLGVDENVERLYRNSHSDDGYVELWILCSLMLIVLVLILVLIILFV